MLGVNNLEKNIYSDLVFFFFLQRAQKNTSNCTKIIERKIQRKNWPLIRDKKKYLIIQWWEPVLGLDFCKLLLSWSCHLSGENTLKLTFYPQNEEIKITVRWLKWKSEHFLSPPSSYLSHGMSTSVAINGWTIQIHKGKKQTEPHEYTLFQDLIWENTIHSN